MWPIAPTAEAGEEAKRDMDNQAFLQAVLDLIAIDSVALTDVGAAAPYGTGPARALAYVMDLCRRLGIRAESPEGKTAWAEIGRGEEIVGVLGHLDVVPAGEGWTHNPRGEVCGKQLYGRGAVDDKGPTLAALFAMKDLQDAGTPMKRRVRLIFGMCEEVGGWEDMEYYKATQQLPVFGFTPDADFPAIYGEKGILEYQITGPRDGLLFLEGGDAGNMVPDWCRCRLLAADGTEQNLETHGRSAHASTPEKGDSAIDKLMTALKAQGVGNPLVDFYCRHLAGDCYGGKLGCALEDAQSGKLTLNVGKLRTEGEKIVLTLDVRNPVTCRREDVEEPLQRACAAFGLQCECTESKDSIYMDKDGEVIRTMVEVYRAVTGDQSEPTVIGGGTYARAMPGIVAFGPMQPGRECTEHQKDEYILLEDLFQAKEIYRRAIEKLANLD